MGIKREIRNKHCVFPIYCKLAKKKEKTMTTKVASMLEQYQALHEILDERAENLTDRQAVTLQELAEKAWLVLDRRSKQR